MIKVPDTWLPLVNKMLLELESLKTQADFSSLKVLWVVEKSGDLTVAFELKPDVDELYQVIIDIIKKYEVLLTTQ